MKQWNEQATKIVPAMWSALGLPISADPLVESREGVVDVEALLIVTWISGAQIRDIPTWATTHRSRINSQKLKSVFAHCSPQMRADIRANAAEGGMGSVPRIAQVLGIPPTTAHHHPRAGKLRRLDWIAEHCRMIHNRLLFGNGFRADLATLLETRRHPATGHEQARILGTNPGTVSRIRADFSAIGQTFKAKFKMLCLSAATISNRRLLAEAEAFAHPELQAETIRQLDTRHDILAPGVIDSLSAA